MNRIEFAISYLKGRGAKIPASLLQSLSDGRVLSIKAGTIHSRSYKQSVDDYSAVRDELWIAVYDGVFDFLNSNSHMGTYSRPVITALSKAYLTTADIAYVDGGGSLPLDDDTQAWARAELESQSGYVDSMFLTLKQLRSEGDFDANATASDRADAYTSALDGFYNSIKMMGAGNKMLTWNLGSAEKHCDTCLNLDGQRHRASWWSSKGYTPHRPGSNTICGGYNCDCSLSDDDGNGFTI